MVSSKLSNLTTPISEIMSEMAQEFNAIDLSKGTTQLPCSDELIRLVNKHMIEGKNQYSSLEGIFPLREVIAQNIEQLYKQKYDPVDEITITAGASEAIYSSITAFIKEGDEVIIFEPAYDIYAPIIRLNGGLPVYVQLKHPDYLIDWQEVTRSINSRTRMIIINSPNNPTGAVLTPSDFEKLNKLVSGSKIIILSDEVYEHIIFDDIEHESIAKYPKLVERSIIVSSFGKSYNVNGWKLGYCIAPKMLTKEFRKIHRLVMFSINTPLQYALADFIKNKENFIHIKEEYQKKRDLLNELLKETDFNVIESKGSYYQLIDYSKVSDEKDKDFAERLVKEYGIATTPLSVFFHQHLDNKVLRICFAKEDEILHKVAERLAQVKIS